MSRRGEHPVDILPSHVDHWSEQAACVGEDPELWFPDTGKGGQRSIREAMEICNKCPVSVQCLDAALDEERGLGVEMRAGIRGATNRDQRAKLDTTPRRVKGQ